MNGVISRLRGPGMIPSTNTSEPLTRKLGDKLPTVAVMGQQLCLRRVAGAQPSSDSSSETNGKSLG